MMSTDFPEDETPNTNDFFICAFVFVDVLAESQFTIHCSKLVSLMKDVATTAEPGHIAFFVPLERRVMSTAA